MSYNFLDHATDAIIEVNAKDLKEAFSVTADAVINLTLDQDKVEEKDTMKFSAHGKDIRYLLFNWIEEITFVLITEGFAIRRVEFDMKIDEKDKNYDISAKAFGEQLDFSKHNFKVEIKAPTFYDMEIKQTENDEKIHENERKNGVYMRFLLDL